jgi:hypothetical protein
MALVSCNKENSLPYCEEIKSSDNIEIRDPAFDLATYQDQEYDGVVNSLALGIVELSKNSSFRTLVHNKVNLKFDGDDNVLFKDLFTPFSGYNSSQLNSSINFHKNSITQTALLKNFYSTMPVYTSSVKIDSMINGYSYNGAKLYPQIYIPFYETVNLNQQPTIVVGYDEFDDDNIPGYQIQANGYVKLVNVDSTYAKSNLVWVVSINETVNDEGTVVDSHINDESLEIRTDTKIAKIKAVNLKLRFDNFWNGKAEVSYIALHLRNNCNRDLILAATPLLKAKYRNVWYTIKDFKSEGLAQLFAFGSPQNFITPGEFVHIMFYEKDNVKKKNRKTYTVISCPTGGETTVVYYSKNPIYGGFNELGYYGIPYDNFSNIEVGLEEYPIIFDLANIKFKLESGKFNQ